MINHVLPGFAVVACMGPRFTTVVGFDSDMHMHVLTSLTLTALMLASYLLYFLLGYMKLYISNPLALSLEERPDLEWTLSQ